MPICSECKIEFSGRKYTALTCSEACGLIRGRRLTIKRLTKKREAFKKSLIAKHGTLPTQDQRHPDNILENQTGLIPERMKEMGLSHEDLALQSKYSVRTIKIVCRGGKISLQCACRLSPILGLAVEAIMAERSVIGFCKATETRIKKEAERTISAMDRKILKILKDNPSITIHKLLNMFPDDYPHKIKEAFRRLK